MNNILGIRSTAEKRNAKSEERRSSLFRFSVFALRFWNVFWFREVPPHAIALFRILCGAWLTVYWLLFAPYVRLMFSRDGTAIPLLPFEAPALSTAWILYALLIICLALVTIGLFFRIASAGAFVLATYHWFVSLHHFGTSFDLLYLFLLLCFALSEADATYSLSQRIIHGSFFAVRRPVSIFAQRLICVQITVTYFGVGMQKLWLPDFQGGEILSWSFMGLWSTPIALWTVQNIHSMEIFDAWNFVVKICEIALPIGLWIKPLQKWTFLGGVLFHVALVLLLGMWWFLAMIASYHLFLDPEHVRKILTTRERPFVDAGHA